MLADSLTHRPPNYNSFRPPARGGAYIDPVFGTRVKRLTDALVTPNAADGGKLTYVTNEYSTMHPFNKPGTFLILQHDSYFGLYDGFGVFLRNLPLAISASTEPRWSRVNHSLLYFVSDNALRSYDVAKDSMTTVHTFPEYVRVAGGGESDLSADGDHIVMAGDGRHIFVFRISTRTKSAVLDAAGRNFDSLYLTPNNNVTVTWLQPGTARFTGIELFNSSMVFQRQLTHAGGHMDVARDKAGDEVLIWTNSADPAPVCGQNAVVKVRLADGQQTCLLSLDWRLAVHISAPDGVGFAWVATEAPADLDPNVSWPPYTNEILQVKLDGSWVRRFAHHRSRPRNSYGWFPRLATSFDGRRVVYASNFNRQTLDGAPTEYTDTYMFTLPKQVAKALVTT